MFDLKALQATLGQLEEERKIPRDKILDAVKHALAAAYKKDYGKKGQIIRAEFDEETGDVHFFQVKLVVDESMAKMPVEGEDEPDEAEDEESEDERFRFDSEKHLLVEDAKKIKSDAKLEDEIVFPLETEEDFGRIAAQTAKQVIIQRIREAEKESILDEYADRQGQILTGMVQKVEGRNVFVDFNRATGILPANEQIPGEFYRPGQRIKVFLVEVQESHRGVNLRLSRSHPLFIEELFKLESPEIMSEVVIIKSIAREPGSRSKIAVLSTDENVDPIGACVGQKGIRVATVMGELNGEKIDIIPWSEDAADFVASALSPARVLDIDLNEEDHTANIEVADDQLSLAIGKGGQNVRLAAKLTGWRIDIKGTESEEKPAADEAAEPAATEEAEASTEETPAEATEEPLAETKEVAEETPTEETTEEAPTEEVADEVAEETATEEAAPEDGAAEEEVPAE